MGQRVNKQFHVQQRRHVHVPMPERYISQKLISDNVGIMKLYYIYQLVKILKKSFPTAPNKDSKQVAYDFLLRSLLNLINRSFLSYLCTPHQSVYDLIEGTRLFWFKSTMANKCIILLIC